MQFILLVVLTLGFAALNIAVPLAYADAEADAGMNNPCRRLTALINVQRGVHACMWPRT